MKNILPFILLFSVINSAHTEPVAPRPLFTSVRTLDTTPVTIELGNYQYKIAANYFFTQPHFDCNHSTVALIANYPNFEGHTVENSNELYRKVGEFNTGVSLLLSADLERRENILKRMQAVKSSIDLVYGPFEKTPYPAYGLAHFSYSGKRPYSQHDDLFINGGESELSTHIHCSLVGSLPSPSCNHSFPVNDLIVKLNYRRTYLPYWKDIESTARALIQNWTIQKLDVLKPYCKQTLSEMMKK